MSVNVELLSSALDSDGSEEGPSATESAVEQMGEPAFTWLAEAVAGGKLSDPHATRALELMSRITRQMCVTRKGDLVDLCERVAVDSLAGASARSAALRILVVNVSLASALRDPVGAYRRSVDELAREVESVAKRALPLGVSRDSEDLANRFLAWRHGRT